jgi:hypothetical protein
VYGAEDSGRDSGEGGGMSIKRYTVIFEEEHIGECETGKFVLYTDHLAVVAERDKIIEKLTEIAYEAEEYVNAQVMLRILTAQKEGYESR